MPEPVSSTGTLSLEARRSYETLGRNAELLGSLSASFSREARQTSDAYRQALSSCHPGCLGGIRRGGRCASAPHSVRSCPSWSLSAHERQAREFFEQIVSENADLLAQRVPAVL